MQYTTQNNLASGKAISSNIYEKIAILFE